jgi:hypothetical protein
MSRKYLQGKFKPINKDKYRGDVENINMRSSWEMRFARWLDGNKDVIEWSSESVVIPYLYTVDNKMHRYFMDFWVKMSNEEIFLIEVKPFIQTREPVCRGRKTTYYKEQCLSYVKNINKWEYADRYALERGWKFLIMSDHPQKKILTFITQTYQQIIKNKGSND